MTNRDFFKILIKVFGLYFFIQTIFSFLPQFSFIQFDENLTERIGSIIYFILVIILSIAILYFLIKFPEKIIDIFKLDKNFDNQKISINNFNAKNILTFSLFIIGGFLIIENINSLISNLYFQFKKSNNPMIPIQTDNGISILFNALNLILGFSLIIFRKSITEYFEK